MSESPEMMERLLLGTDPYRSSFDEYSDSTPSGNPLTDIYAVREKNSVRVCLTPETIADFSELLNYFRNNQPIPRALKQRLERHLTKQNPEFISPLAALDPKTGKTHYNQFLSTEIQAELSKLNDSFLKIGTEKFLHRLADIRFVYDCLQRIYTDPKSMQVEELTQQLDELYQTEDPLYRAHTETTLGNGRQEHRFGKNLRRFSLLSRLDDSGDSIQIFFGSQIAYISDDNNPLIQLHRAANTNSSDQHALFQVLHWILHSDPKNRNPADFPKECEPLLSKKLQYGKIIRQALLYGRLPQVLNTYLQSQVYSEYCELIQLFTLHEMYEQIKAHIKSDIANPFPFEKHKFEVLRNTSNFPANFNADSLIEISFASAYPHALARAQAELPKALARLDEELPASSEPLSEEAIVERENQAIETLIATAETEINTAVAAACKQELDELCGAHLNKDHLTMGGKTAVTIIVGEVIEDHFNQNPAFSAANMLRDGLRTESAKLQQQRAATRAEARQEIAELKNKIIQTQVELFQRDPETHKTIQAALQTIEERIAASPEALDILEQRYHKELQDYLLDQFNAQLDLGPSRLTTDDILQHSAFQTWQASFFKPGWERIQNQKEQARLAQEKRINTAIDAALYNGGPHLTEQMDAQVKAWVEVIAHQNPRPETTHSDTSATISAHLIDALNRLPEDTALDKQTMQAVPESAAFQTSVEQLTRQVIHNADERRIEIAREQQAAREREIAVLQSNLDDLANQLSETVTASFTLRAKISTHHATMIADLDRRQAGLDHKKENLKTLRQDSGPTEYIQQEQTALELQYQYIEQERQISLAQALKSVFVNPTAETTRTLRAFNQTKRSLKHKLGTDYEFVPTQIQLQNLQQALELDQQAKPLLKILRAIYLKERDAILHSMRIIGLGWSMAEFGQQDNGIRDIHTVNEQDYQSAIYIHLANILIDYLQNSERTKIADFLRQRQSKRGYANPSSEVTEQRLKLEEHGELTQHNHSEQLRQLDGLSDDVLLKRCDELLQNFAETATLIFDPHDLQSYAEQREFENRARAEQEATAQRAEQQALQAKQLETERQVAREAARLKLDLERQRQSIDESPKDLTTNIVQRKRTASQDNMAAYPEDNAFTMGWLESAFRDTVAWFASFLPGSVHDDDLAQATHTALTQQQLKIPAARGHNSQPPFEFEVYDQKLIALALTRYSGKRFRLSSPELRLEASRAAQWLKPEAADNPGKLPDTKALINELTASNFDKTARLLNSLVREKSGVNPKLVKAVIQRINSADEIERHAIEQWLKTRALEFNNPSQDAELLIQHLDEVNINLAHDLIERLGVHADADKNQNSEQSVQDRRLIFLLGSSFPKSSKQVPVSSLMPRSDGSDNSPFADSDRMAVDGSKSIQAGIHYNPDIRVDSKRVFFRYDSSQRRDSEGSKATSDLSITPENVDAIKHEYETRKGEEWLGAFRQLNSQFNFKQLYECENDKKRGEKLLEQLRKINPDNSSQNQTTFFNVWTDGDQPLHQQVNAALIGSSPSPRTSNYHRQTL